MDRLRYEQGKVMIDLEQVKAGRDYAPALYEEIKIPDVLVNEGLNSSGTDLSLKSSVNL